MIGMDAAGRVGAEEQHSKREDPQEQKVRERGLIVVIDSRFPL